MADFKKEGALGGGPIRPRTNFLAQPKLVKASAQNNPFRKAETGEPADGDAAASNLFAPPPKRDKDDAQKAQDVVPKFVPLLPNKEAVSFAGGNAVKGPEVSCASDFVFGQNLKERIVSRAEDDKGDKAEDDGEHAGTNGSSNSLFSAVPPPAENHSPSKTDGNSLAQSAETWERIRESSMPSMPPPQQAFTGEEGETNQLQLNCRIFAFEGGLWKERGRGHLRVNDGPSCSRLVCRSSGSLRIMLNTNIWGGMTVERPGNKSLRITATDSQQQLKVFLIMASPDEISHLHDMLSLRVILAQKAEKLNGGREGPSAASNDNGADEPSNSEPPADPASPRPDGDEADAARPAKTSAPSDNSSNPTVVVSNSEEVDTNIRETLKRPKTEDNNCVPKKMCMEFPSEDAPL